MYYKVFVQVYRFVDYECSYCW